MVADRVICCRFLKRVSLTGVIILTALQDCPNFEHCTGLLVAPWTFHEYHPWKSFAIGKDKSAEHSRQFERTWEKIGNNCYVSCSNSLGGTEKIHEPSCITLLSTSHHLFRLACGCEKDDWRRSYFVKLTAENCSHFWLKKRPASYFRRSEICILRNDL